MDVPGSATLLIDILDIHERVRNGNAVANVDFTVNDGKDI